MVGSGILGERLAGGNTAIALLANALATGAALFALIEWFAPLSGAHFDPLVTLALALRGDITSRAAAAYVPIQIIGAIAGVGVAHAMFELPVFSLSTHVRSGPAQLLSEFVSTFGLVGAVWVCSPRMRPSSVAGVVATYIGGAFWFTATDFANPAVTLARALTDTFSGVPGLPMSPGFIIAEIAGAIADGHHVQMASAKRAPKAGELALRDIPQVSQSNRKSPQLRQKQNPAVRGRGFVGGAPKD